MMNKTSIKVIKRKDAEAAVNVKTKNTGKTKLTATVSEEKIERNLHRRMVDTVSNWITERRENNRNEVVSALRNLFGDESLLNKTA